MGRLKVDVATYTGVAVAHSFIAPDHCTIQKITAHFSATPTTNEDFTVTQDMAAGAAYDVVLYEQDPVAIGLVNDLVASFTAPYGELMRGDGLAIAYTNTDVATIGLSIFYEVHP